MKRKILLLGSVVLSCSLFANNLEKQALDSGIIALPSDSKALEEMINNVEHDSQKFPTTMVAYELGKRLYFEPRFSKSGIISCNTCRNLGLGGADGIPASNGHQWTPNPHNINAPTVYNSVFNSVQFWDGRATHLTEQAAGPMTGTPEMASTPKLVV